MKNNLLLALIFIGSVAFSQSYKNIEKYDQENTKIVNFNIDTTRFITEEILVLTRILYSYPDIYFADVNTDGNGIAFIAKTSVFEKFLDELYNEKSYTLTNITYENYSDDVFIKTYQKSHFKSHNDENKVILGIEDKDNLNYKIANEINNN